MAPLAVVADLALTRTLTPMEQAFAETMLRRASTKLRVQAPGLDDRITADPLLGELAKDAICAAVERALSNPELLASLATNDGPFNKSRGFGKPAENLLYFTDDDLKGIVRVTTTSIPGMVRISG